ncbi:Hypothetical predicted protein [Podarcis lilfordi]|uniref:Uncharacterized protein n=1 Tax=Podarcis lilfordi TaxID=74358 RepID=A0AA35JSF7_9SAUR|nr:Hypothetical predicted protein [Podarcis lilfordi]
MRVAAGRLEPAKPGKGVCEGRGEAGRLGRRAPSPTRKGRPAGGRPSSLALRESRRPLRAPKRRPGEPSRARGGSRACSD